MMDRARTLLAGVWLLGCTSAMAVERISFAHQRLGVDGAPAATFSLDLDRDGLRDLVMVVVSTEWGEIGIEERMEIDEVGTFVEVLTVVPALFDRRELVVHLGVEGGGFAAEPARMELDETVHAVLPGPSGAPLLAWTDEGVSAVEPGEDGLALVPVIEAASPIAGSGDFLSGLKLAHDLDGDGELDLLLPVESGYAVFLGSPEGLAPEAVARFPAPLEERLPGDAEHYRRGSVRHLPIPEVLDLDGDRRPELVFRNHDREWNQMRVLPNLGGGRFGAPVDPLAGRAPEAEPEVLWVGDLDGDGRAEIVTQEEHEPESDKMRDELAHAKRPRMTYRVHAIGPGLVWNPAPTRTFELLGYIFEGSDDVPLPVGVRDLDGDGRPDLVAMTLDFSLASALRVMTLRSLRLGLDFEPVCQRADGGFRSVPGQDLGGKFTLRLTRLRFPQLSSFAGDFDGDGRADFLQLGRGKKVAVRRGEPGCRYPEASEATIELAAEPADLALVRVEDLDGDGKSDLAVTQPPPPGEAGGTGWIDLYLSGARR